MARSPVPRKRGRRRKSELRNSMWLGLLLVGLTGINVYVFFFRDDTAVRKIMQPQATGRSLSDAKAQAIASSIPKSLRGIAADLDDRKLETGAPTTAGGTRDGSNRVIEGKVGPSDTLLTVLAREGLATSAANIVKALSKHVDAKTIRPGDAYVVNFDELGEPESFEYAPSPALRYTVSAAADGSWKVKKQEAAIEVRTAEAAGVIDSSLYESVQKSGESGALVALLVDIFAWDINFYIDTHPGDHWKVVVEKQYLGGQFYKYGNVLAAEYGGKVGTHRAFHWNATPGRGSGKYYDEKGQAIAKTLLKTPLRFVRISSKFDPKRFHPVLHRVKAHLGVDYAAPTGTPIWASASGRIVEAQMKRGSGNTVVINHGNGLNTRYYHLSKFAKGLTVGKYVQQKELIGYVGSTGLSTGPHLHFSVTRNGAFVDPSKLAPAREAPVANRAGYLQAIRPRIAALKSLAPVLAKN